MRLFIKIAAPVLLLFTAAAAAAVAFAAPVAPTTVYPSVTINPDVCQVENLEVKKQQLAYDTAKADYDRIYLLYTRGSAAIGDVRAAERAVDLAGIKLNDAKYAEAKCQNDKGNDPKKDCIALALELNRMLDELPLRKALEQLAYDDYQAGLRLAQTGSISATELDKLKLAYQTAVLDRQQLELKIKQQRDTIAANAACKDYPSERPAPTPTPTPTSPSPSPTSPSPSPTSTSPAPTSSSPGPTDTTSSPTATTDPTISMEPAVVG